MATKINSMKFGDFLGKILPKSVTDFMDTPDVMIGGPMMAIEKTSVEALKKALSTATTRQQKSLLTNLISHAEKEAGRISQDAALDRWWKEAIRKSKIKNVYNEFGTGTNRANKPQVIPRTKRVITPKVSPKVSPSVREGTVSPSIRPQAARTAAEIAREGAIDTALRPGMSRLAKTGLGAAGVGTLAGAGMLLGGRPDVADSSPEALQAMQNAPGASVSGTLGDGVTSQGAAAPTGTGVANSELDVIPQVRGQQAGQINATPPPVNAGAPEKRMDKKGGIDWWSMLKPVVAGVAGTAIAGKFGGKDAAAGFAQGFGNTLETRRGEQRQDKLAQEKQAREDKKSANENFWLGVQMGIPEMAQVNLDKMGDITEEERIAYKEAIGSANTRKSEMQRSNESAAKLKHLQMAGAYVGMGMLGDAVTLINSAQPDESLHVTEGTLLGGKRREMEEMLIKTYVTANGAMPDKANMDMIKDTVLNMYKSVSQRQSEAVLATLAEKVKESIDAGDIVTIKKLLESKPDMNPELRKMLLDAQTKIEQLGRSRTPDETAYDIGESIGNLPNQIGQAAGSVTPNSVMDFLPNIFPSTHLLNTVSQAGGAGNLRQAIPNILRGAGGGNR
jgi:hypothetical protein